MQWRNEQENSGNCMSSRCISNILCLSSNIRRNDLRDSRDDPNWFCDERRIMSLRPSVSHRRIFSSPREFTWSKRIAEWQEEWNESEKYCWAHRIISDIRKWIERTHGGVSFNLIHGGRRAYLYRFGHTNSKWLKIEGEENMFYFKAPGL